MQVEKQWRCPECDTINKGNVCIVCGEIHSDNVQEKNVQAPSPKSDNYVKKYKILFFISTLLAIFITAMVTTIIVEKRTSQIYIEQFDVSNTMNKNAQVIYSTALNYCLKSIENNSSLADGFYSFEINSGTGEAVFDGTKNDFRSYFSAYYNTEYTQYCAVCVTNGLPIISYWSTSSISNEVVNISQENIIKEDLIIGIYPAIWRNNTALTYIDKSPTISNTEQIEEENEIVSDTSLNNNKEITSDSFDSDMLCSEILKCINSDRGNEGIYELRQSERSKEFAEQIHTALSNGTYQKGMMADKQTELADYANFYYEKEFDISPYSSESEIARALIDYEKENFSSDWMAQVHQYYYAVASFKDNNTVCVVFTVIGDKTASVGNEIYERDLTELDLSNKNLIPADIVNLPYFYNLEVLKLDNNSIQGTDVFSKMPKLNTLWLDNNGITNISFLTNCKNLKVITLNHNQISNVTPFENMTQLEKVYINDNKIVDLSPFYKLTNLTELDIRENEINSQELKELSDALSNKPKISFGN